MAEAWVSLDVVTLPWEIRIILVGNSIQDGYCNCGPTPERGCRP